jgi:hypothetical protein
VEDASQGAGGASEIVCKSGEGEPGGVRLDVPGRGVRESTVLDVCDHLFHEGVSPVITLGVREGGAVSR